MKRKRAPSMTEKAAASLLKIKRGDGSWLIPEPMRSKGSAAEIVRSVEWHHKHMHTFGGDTSPQNIDPLAPLEHKRETIRLRPQITKVKRQEKRRAAQVEADIAKETNEPVATKPKRKSQCEYTRLKPYFKRKVQGGKVVRRET
jgi:hypothetical protein